MASVMHLVRHGEVENPDQLVYADLKGFGLSRKGRLQAAWAGNHLADHPVRAVYTSPLDRALETARSIAVPHGLRPLILEELTEWTLLSRWAGRPWADLDAYYPGELDNYLSNPIQMDFASESLAGLARRMADVVNRLADRHPDQDLVVVSHQDPIQAAYLYLLGYFLGELHTDKPDHGEVISLVRKGTVWNLLARIAPPF
ncbi:MAG: histidine phosphatase family protein [Acidimicrobiia bacterium]|nr:histidine phosphatase family protein [Acidimicrobiia bacterium]